MPGGGIVDWEILRDFEAKNWGIGMADTAGDVTGGGEDRPSAGGSAEEGRVVSALQILVSRLKHLSGVDWTRGEPVATLDGDRQRGDIVKEMVPVWGLHQSTGRSFVGG